MEGLKALTLAEAIEIVDPDSGVTAHDDVVQDTVDRFMQACRVVCAAARRAAPGNKALTLEELRSAIENKPNGWLWLEAFTDSRESLYQRNEITYRWSNITNYGKTWLAYGLRPEAAP